MSEAISPDVPGEGGQNVGIVDTDRPCVQCSYNLRGVPITGKCPECGTDVAASLKGILLQHAGTEYLTTLRSGLSLVLNGLLLYIVMMVGMTFVAIALQQAPTAIFNILGGVLGLLIAGMIMFGYFKYSAPDPGYIEPPAEYVGQKTPVTSRKTLRAAVVVQACIALLQFVFALLVTRGIGTGVLGIVNISMGVISLIAWIVQFLAVMDYTSWLGHRVPDHYIIKRTKRYKWLLPVIAVVGLLLAGLGPLIALVMYWNLLDRLRKHLKTILKTGVPAELPKKSA